MKMPRKLRGQTPISNYAREDTIDGRREESRKGGEQPEKGRKGSGRRLTRAIGGKIRGKWRSIEGNKTPLPVAITHIQHQFSRDHLSLLMDG